MKTKIVSTILNTGDSLLIPSTNLVGTVGVYKNGNIKVLWKINETSGFSENLPTREWNRRIKEGKVIVVH